MADQYPLGSDDRLEWLEQAHTCFMAPKPGKGPHKRVLEDNKAIDFMLKTSWSGAVHISARRLAEMAVAKGLAAKRGGKGREDTASREKADQDAAVAQASREARPM